MYRIFCTTQPMVPMTNVRHKLMLEVLAFFLLGCLASCYATNDFIQPDQKAIPLVRVLKREAAARQLDIILTKETRMRRQATSTATFTGSITTTTPVPACTAGPCFNGGTCIQGGTSAFFTCRCLDGYSGGQCQTEINQCASAPCQNGATCVHDFNSYSCSCPPGIRGTTCSLVDGMWGAWAVGACSVTCGSGQQQRSRTCIFPDAGNRGQGCMGASQETLACQEDECPVLTQVGYAAMAAGLTFVVLATLLCLLSQCRPGAPMRLW